MAIHEYLKENLSLLEKGAHESSWQKDLVYIYSGLRVRLRSVRESDAATSFAWRTDPVVRDGEIGYPFPISLDAEIAWVRSSNSQGAAPNTIILGIEDIKNRSLIGYASVYGIDWPSRVGELGLLIGPASLRGTGIGYEALQLFLKICFFTYGLSRVWLRVLEGNIPARRLYEKCGFSYEGFLRNHVFNRGAYRNVMVMGILAEEFTQQEIDNPFWQAKLEEDKV